MHKNISLGTCEEDKYLLIWRWFVQVEVCVLFDDIDSHGRNEILEVVSQYPIPDDAPFYICRIP